jgi:monomeric sarcosine oxidase
MEAKTFDVIVIGMGVAGAGAAYHLAKRSVRVLALEQFELDHQLGSSYGESRIIRYAYKESVYVDMAKEVFPMWHTLEQESGQKLLTRSGGLDFGPSDYGSLIDTRDNLAAGGIAYDWLTPAEVSKRFPQFHLDDNMMAIYQPDAATMNASLCVRALAEIAQKNGLVLKSQCPVTKIEPLADSVNVHTPQGIFSAGKVIISAGAWAGKLLDTLDLHLPLTPTRQEQCFFEPTNRAQFAAGTFPVFIYHNEPWYYGLPDMGTGLKVAVHNLTIPTDPDNTSREKDEAIIEEVKKWVQHFIPTADSPIRETRVCLYTMTPDEHFLIDTHPAHANIVIASPCSGHGFKFGILTGRMAADLAQGQTLPHNMFSVRRFL